jgi:hypothetical protein
MDPADVPLLAPGYNKIVRREYVERVERWLEIL